LADTNAIIEQLRAVFMDSFHIEVASADTDLLETGMLDSLQLVELLLLLEQQLGFRVPIDQLELDDLRSIARLARLVVPSAAAADPSPAHPPSRASGQGATNSKASAPAFRPRASEPCAHRATERNGIAGFSLIGSPQGTACVESPDSAVDRQ
jgi:methoxymalonate biosynthesis acyl carrier protein